MQPNTPSKEPSPPNNPQVSNLTETILQQAFLLAEIGMDLKQRYVTGEKHVYYLKSVLDGADKSLSSLKHISKRSLEHAQQLIRQTMAKMTLSINTEVKTEFEKLLSIIDKQILDFDDVRCDQFYQPIQISERIKYMESKQKSSDHNLCHPSNSAKSIKMDIDEKYPENLSRESLIDLNNVLPSVPEDIFTSFPTNKPTRSSSLSSLKSMRKVKLFLQKVENSDEEESSENEEFAKYYGDSEDNKVSSSYCSPKKHLGNIKEESQD